MLSNYLMSLQALFYNIKEDLDSEFLHPEREKDKYMIKEDKIANKLSLFIINHIY